MAYDYTTTTRKNGRCRLDLYTMPEPDASVYPGQIGERPRGSTPRVPGIDSSPGAGNRLSVWQQLRLRRHPVKPVRKVRRVRVDEMDRFFGYHVGADGDPSDQVRGGFQAETEPVRGWQTKVEFPIGQPHARRTG